jgi:predicted TIM-barrel fold metal-dependent hydrolase
MIDPHRRGGGPLLAILVGAALASGLAAPVGAQTDPRGQWRENATYRRIAGAVDVVPSIDNHSHLLSTAPFDPRLDPQMPWRLRSTNPQWAAVIKERLALDWDTTRSRELDAEGRRRRAAQVAAAGGEAAYWIRYLDDARTDVVLVNQERASGTDGRRLRWVPFASTLLVPLPAAALEARSPMARDDVVAARRHLLELLRDDQARGVPATLDGYLAFVGRQLRRWRSGGAVAVKFYEAYHRTLRFEEVPLGRARELYARGQQRTLGRADYLALQDYIAWSIFRIAGEAGLAVHIHSSHGAGPFLRLGESDVRNLEGVLTDPRLFGTQFVLIHGGAPWHEAAAYLAANKPHVWIDISALPFLYPVPDLADVLRKYLTFAPERTLFGTDVLAFPGTPVGTEFVHLALTRHLRESLSLALARLVEDGTFSESEALGIGRGVLRENSRRLYHFE